MITLYQFPAGRDLPNLSPFCMSVETYLKIAGIDYESEFVRNPGKAPKGKLPYVRDGATLIADSWLILENLERVHRPDFGITLSDEEKILSHALERVINEFLCWGVLWQRWATPEGWSKLEPLFFGNLPWHLKLWVPRMVRKKMLNSLHCQGMIRHSKAELKQFFKKDMEALAKTLGDKPYFFGAAPTRIDAVALAFLANVYRFRIEGALTEVADSFPTLKSYTDRMMTRVWDIYS